MIDTNELRKKSLTFVERALIDEIDRLRHENEYLLRDRKTDADEIARLRQLVVEAQGLANKAAAAGEAAVKQRDALLASRGGAQDEFEEILRAVVAQLEGREGRDGNAPGHGHSTPGIWDEDNGDLAGKPCAWCALWRKAKELVAAAPSPEGQEAEHSPTPVEGQEAECPRCKGAGVIDDGEIDCYPNGEPFEHGPVKCVKDCPECTHPAPAEGWAFEAMVELAYSAWMNAVVNSNAGNKSAIRIALSAALAAQQQEGEADE